MARNFLHFLIDWRFVVFEYDAALSCDVNSSLTGREQKRATKGPLSCVTKDSGIGYTITDIGITYTDRSWVFCPFVSVCLSVTVYNLIHKHIPCTGSYSSMPEALASCVRGIHFEIGSQFAFPCRFRRMLGWCFRNVIIAFPHCLCVA
jgi:hypothetical protein